MALEIKICGLKTVEAIDVAVSRGATHVGFVHFAKSPRHLALNEMAALRPCIRPPVKLAVVLVDPDDALFAEIVQRVSPDILQLHGRETPERVAAVRAMTGLAVTKALSIGSGADLEAVALYRDVADHLLLDAKKPKGSELPGGNGVSFDWRLLAGLPPRTRYMLSGGISPDNVAEVIAEVSPAGIDLSSGVESAPGVKDPTLIHALFDALQASAAHSQRKAS
ncbi:phosphoribosylanthranilate isomerase [Aureimonas psammosilenae]|uniref:phosphoribosylanthranilate isomerase n=1 Tax=Aureimonas psammosilenae TaxID=2495496 RepID=UPI00126105FD|nr:phosphoribosylanthranilate isomerase [Aureimonas psammosilenae]